MSEVLIWLIAAAIVFALGARWSDFMEKRDHQKKQDKLVKKNWKLP